MDMKKILQALDTASSKPVEGSNDMKKFLSVVTEGANPHKVTLPVQMAMQHYTQPVVEKPKTIKEVKKTAMSNMLYQYYAEAQEEVDAEEVAKKELISEHARKIAERVLAKESRLDELSKDTLRDYVKANKEDTVQRASSASFKSGKEGDKYNKADETHKDKMREKGLDSALNKLSDPDYDKKSVKEEIESVLAKLSESEVALLAEHFRGRDEWDSNMPGHERYAGMGRREREDDEYHVPDPVDNRIAYKVIATVTTQDGNEEKKGVSIKTVSGPKHAETVATKHLEGAGFQVKSIDSVQDLGPV